MQIGVGRFTGQFAIQSELAFQFLCLDLYEAGKMVTETDGVTGGD
jgi:hypothetical protein